MTERQVWVDPTHLDQTTARRWNASPLTSKHAAVRLRKRTPPLASDGGYTFTRSMVAPSSESLSSMCS